MDLTPRVRTLLEAALVRPAAALEDAERRRLVAQSSALGLFPVYARLLGNGEDTAQLLDETRRTHQARRLWVRHTAQRALAALAPVGPVVLLKGEPLAVALMGDAALRTSTDVDLLLAPPQIKPAIAALAALGYRAEALRPWTYNQVMLTAPKLVPIELHWRLALPPLPAPAVAEVLAQRQGCSLWPGTALSILPPDLCFIHLLLHAHQHLGALKTLVDIAAWLDRCAPEVDLHRVQRRVSALGLRGVMAWALATVGTLCGEPLLGAGGLATRFGLSPAVLDRFAVRRFVRHSTHAVAHAMLGADQAPGRALYLVGQGRRLRDKVLGVGLQGASMALLDTAGARWRGLGGAWLLGPHRVGEAVNRVRWRRRAFFADEP